VANLTIIQIRFGVSVVIREGGNGLQAVTFQTIIIAIESVGNEGPFRFIFILFSRSLFRPSRFVTNETARR
jgi:hypothetical protein